MDVDTQHTVAKVDQNVETGSRGIDVTVGTPYSFGTTTSVSITVEAWILVRFWFDPVSAHTNQQTETITVDVFSSEPGTK